MKETAMKHRATLTGAVCALFFLVCAAPSTPAHAAPVDPFTKPAMKAKAPAARPAPAPAPRPAPAPMGQASAGSPTPAPMADLGVTASTRPGGEQWLKDDPRRRYHKDHNLTGIIITTTLFLCILLLVGTIQYMGFRKDRNKHQTLQLMVEKGAQIPVELITSQKRRGSDLRRGLVLLGAGLGITLFLLMTKDARSSGAFGLGLIPALIGAGYLLAWKLEGRSKQPRPTMTYANGDDLARTPRDELDVGGTQD
jgi:hypothetical protein